MRKKKSHNPEEARTPNSYQRDFLLVLAAVAATATATAVNPASRGP